MDWKEVRIEINRPAAEALANILEELGTQGVVVDESPGRVALTAYYPDNQDFEQVLAEIKEKAAGLGAFGLDTGELNFEIRETRDEDWSTSWYKYFRPQLLGERFIITPSWEPYQGDDRIEIRIDPGMAFGVGSHETTRLSLELMEKYLTGKGNVALTVDKEDGLINILDIGTGTGILAIAAAKMGYDQILGIDIDPAAVQAARENCRLNGVDGKVQIIKQDLTGGLTERFSLIIANLLPDIIKRLLPGVPPLLKEDGILILSGINIEKKNAVISQAREEGFEPLEEVLLGEWVSLVVRKG